MRSYLEWHELVSLYRLPASILAQREREGSLGWVRIDGDHYITQSAALTMLLEGKYDEARERDNDVKHAQAVANAEAKVIAKAEAERDADRAVYNEGLAMISKARHARLDAENAAHAASIEAATGMVSA